MRATSSLVERDAEDVIPAAMLNVVLEPRVARREILARWLALAGPVTVREMRARYGWPAAWIEKRIGEWEENGKLVRGRFRREVEAPEWATRRIVELARNRALAALRKADPGGGPRDASPRFCSAGSISIRASISMARAA